MSRTGNCRLYSLFLVGIVNVVVGLAVCLFSRVSCFFQLVFIASICRLYVLKSVRRNFLHLQCSLK